MANAANAVPTTADVVSPVRADTAPASAPGNPETVDVKSLTGSYLVKAPTAGGMEAADAAVAEKLRDLLANRLGKFISRDDDRAAVERSLAIAASRRFLAYRGRAECTASAAIAYLRQIGTHRLDPDDYPVPDFAAASDPEARARADVTLTDLVLTFARHARTGRVHFTRVSAAISYQLQYPDPAEVLSRVAASDNPGETLGSYHPQQPGYKALKAKLAEARAKIGEPEAIVRVPEGPMLRPGMEDSRVPVLRTRLTMTADADSLRYDDNVAEAVKSFQRQAGLSPDGLLGPNTLARLNGKAGSCSDVVDTISPTWSAGAGCRTTSARPM